MEVFGWLLLLSHFVSWGYLSLTSWFTGIVDISASSSLVSVLKEGSTNPAEFKTAFAVLTFVSLAVAPRWQPVTERPQDSASAYEEAQRERTEGGRVLGESS